jgi:ribosomal protein RSM22 (predicted rRNA methylase)
MDIGAGPAVGAFLGAQYCAPTRIHLVEQDHAFLKCAQVALIQCFKTAQITGERTNIVTEPIESAHFMIASYVLTEMKTCEAIAVYKKMLESSLDLNLIVLPGTKDAHKFILACKDIAISSGFTIIGPCPHEQTCPMANNTQQQDKPQSWCHFRQNVMRSKEHMHAKNGTLGYEEEPYCYLFVKRNTTNTTDASKTNFVQNYSKARVVQSPSHKKGHMYLDVCHSDGTLKTLCFSKKQKSIYSLTRKLKWGDSFNDNFH